jgi:hypothetical protein
VYDAPADWPSSDPDNQELIALPMLVDDDGEPTEAAFLATVAIRRNAQSIADQEGIPPRVIRLKSRPYKARAKAKPQPRARPTASRP